MSNVRKRGIFVTLSILVCIGVVMAITGNYGTSSPHGCGANCQGGGKGI